MIDQNRNNYKTFFWIVSVILVIALIVLLYFFVAKPQFNNYIIKKQVEASDFVIGMIIQQVQNQGYVSLSYLNNSIILIPYIQGGK